jgi:hypothetical protein
MQIIQNLRVILGLILLFAGAYIEERLLISLRRLIE